MIMIIQMESLLELSAAARYDHSDGMIIQMEFVRGDHSDGNCADLLGFPNAYTAF